MARLRNLPPSGENLEDGPQVDGTRLCPCSVARAGETPVTCKAMCSVAGKGRSVVPTSIVRAPPSSMVTDSNIRTEIVPRGKWEGPLGFRQPSGLYGALSFGEFTCDATKRVETLASYSFVRKEKTMANAVIDVTYRGWVFFPALNGKPVAGPVVIVTHGQVFNGTADHYKTGYSYLAKCLASNGMVVVSIDTTASSKDKANGVINNPGLRAEKFLVHINNIVSEIKLQKGVDLTGQPLVLIGHSQGGEGAVIAADRVQKGFGGSFSIVEAVVALAPRFSPQDFSYGKSFSKSLLVMHGSLDLDQWDNSGIRLYNFASAMAYKGLVWIFGGSHAGFIDSILGSSASDGTLLVPEGADGKLKIHQVLQNWLTRIYVIEFLRWRVGKNPTNPIVLRGIQLPSKQGQPSIPPNSADVTLQPPLFSDGVVDFFFNNMAVTAGFTSAQGPGGLSQVCSSCVSTEIGYRLKWKLGATEVPPSTRFTIQNLPPSPLLLKSLIFNAVRVVDSALNIMSEPVFAKVSLAAKGKPASSVLTVRIADSQRLETTSGDTNLSKSVLCTVTIPFFNFPGMTNGFLDELVSVNIKFDTQKTGDILLTTPRISMA